MQPHTHQQWAAYFDGRCAIKWSPLSPPPTPPILSKEDLPYYALGIMEQIATLK